MLPLVTLQAAALAKIRPDSARGAASAKPAATAPATPTPPRPHLFRRVLDALVPTRVRRTKGSH
jgi:hypothetical protein